MILGEHGAVLPGLGSHLHAPAAPRVERHLEELRLGGIVSAEHPHHAVRLVELHATAQTWLRRRQRADQPAVASAQLELRGAVALGHPQKRAAVLEPLRHAAEQVEPRIVRLGQQRRGRAGRGVHREQHLFGLRAVLHQEGEGGVLLPDDGGEVGVALAVPGDPGGLPSRHRDESERHLGVLLPRPRIGPALRLALGMRGVGDAQHLDARDVGVLVGDGAAVRRPPVALRPAHLLLRDELGLAVRDVPAAALREPVLLSRRHIGHVQVVVAHARELRRVGREARVDGEATRARELAHGAGGALDHEQPARERYQDAPAVARELIRDDAAGALALPLAPRALLDREALLGTAQDAGRGEQHALLLARHVVLVEILHDAARTRAQEEHRLAVGRQRDRVRLAEPEAPGGGELGEEGVGGSPLCVLGSARPGRRFGSRHGGGRRVRCDGGRHGARHQQRHRHGDQATEDSHAALAHGITPSVSAPPSAAPCG